jgi:hypothetical protein
MRACSNRSGRADALMRGLGLLKLASIISLKIQVEPTSLTKA